jgi:hypothetical protein
MASRAALDLPYWEMCLALYHLTCMAVEITNEEDVFFAIVDCLLYITVLGLSVLPKEQELIPEY